MNTYIQELPTFSEIQAHHEQNKQEVHLVRLARISQDAYLSEHTGAEVFRLDETQQHTNAFKVRGALAWCRSNADILDNGVVASSAGNFAQAVAFCARNYDIPAHIFMPEDSPEYKVNRTARFGGEKTVIHLAGSTVDEATIAAKEYCEENDIPFMHPFDDAHVVNGNGTLGMEIIDAFKANGSIDLDYIVTAVGGGGLLSGIMTAVREIKSDMRFIGAEPLGAASLTHALRTDTVETGLHEIDTFIDGAAVKRVGAIALATTQTCGDLLDVIKVSNEHVKEVATRNWEKMQMYPQHKDELTAFLPQCAIEITQGKLAGKRVLYVASGSNLSAERYNKEVRVHAS